MGPEPARWRPDWWPFFVSSSEDRWAPARTGSNFRIGWDRFGNLEKGSKKTLIFSGRFGPPRAPWWPETDSPRKIITQSGAGTRFRALGTRFVAPFSDFADFARSITI